MRWGRKNRQAMRRMPHPDPRVEAELRKILMLRRMADGYEGQIGHYMLVVHGAQDEASERQASRTEEWISALGGEMCRVHEEIAELIAKLPDTDLTFLEPAPL